MESEYYAKKAHEAIDEIHSKFLAAEKRAEDINGQIVPLKKYETTKFDVGSSLRRWFEASYCSSYSSGEPRGPEAWRKELDKIHESNKEIQKENSKIAKDNKDLLDRLLALIKSLGVPERELRKVPRTRTGKRDWFPCEWLTIARFFPTSDGFYSVEQKYKNDMKTVDQWEKKKQDKEREERQKKEKETKKKQSDLKLARLLVANDLPDDYGPEDVLDHVLKKSKYLHLAHYLERNRNDWTDNYSYAEAGLNFFTIENETDQEIFDCINGLIEDWDGDGRCFRDCKWNYGEIYGLVPKALFKEYEEVLKLEGLDIF